MVTYQLNLERMAQKSWDLFLEHSRNMPDIDELMQVRISLLSFNMI